jgi:hypothetical protein
MFCCLMNSEKSPAKSELSSLDGLSSVRGGIMSLTERPSPWGSAYPSDQYNQILTASFEKTPQLRIVTRWL